MANTSTNIRTECEICGASEKLTKHHLIPQVKCKNKYAGLKNEENNHIWICDLCHRTIHAYFSENELRNNLNTKEKLLDDEKFSKFVEWRKKHLNFSSNSTKRQRNRY